MIEGARNRLAESRRALMDAITDLDEEGFRGRAAHGEWTVAETLAHLLDAERFLGEQVMRALAPGRHTVPSRTDEERSEGARQAQRMPVPQIVHALLAQRRDTLRLLEGLSDEQLARAVQHLRRGRVDVAWLFQRMASHEAEHAAQITTLRRRGEARA